MRTIPEQSETKKRNLVPIAIGIGIAALVLSATGIGLLLTASGPARPAPVMREIRLIISSVEPHNTSMMMEEQHLYFPSVIVANRGDTIVLTIVNMDEHRHGFEIHDLNVETDQLNEVAPGEEIVLTIVANQAGVFVWECNVPYDATAMPQDCGKDHNEMTGYLIVQ